MREPPPVLRGFNGHVLRRPSFVHAVMLSFYLPLFACASLVIAALPTLIVQGLGLKWVNDLALGWAITVVAFAGMFRPLVLRDWKFRYVNPRCGIISLRRFDNDSASYLSRNLVGPVFGCYGVVNVVSDESFVRAGDERKVNGAIPDYQFLGDPQIALQFPDEKWRRGVLSYIAMSDFAVIDLTFPSANILWEMACCVTFLPPHRVFIVGAKGTPWPGMMELVNECLAAVLPEGAPPVELRRPIDYGGFLFGRLRFRLRVFRSMWATGRFDRTVAAGGTWRPPEPVSTLEEK